MAKKTSMGGMAVMEGVMMMGPEKMAVAVRKPDGEIIVDKKPLPPIKTLMKIPFVRGCFLLVRQMVMGIKSLMFSADFFDIEEEEGKEPSKIDKFFEKVFGDKLKDAAIYFSVVLSLGLSIGLFILLPNFLVGLAKIKSNIINNLIEGVLRVLIFFTYIILATKMDDIKRVWRYHGAEHKTIHCYESQEELTPENAQKFSTRHPRCGTSFLFLVMIISIIVFSFAGWHQIWLNILIRLLLIPVVAGISYELIKLAGKSRHKIFKIISIPGMFFQRYTTMEPDKDMLEVAITAFNNAKSDDVNADEL